MRLAFRILNVFTVDGNRLSGNPLCVFEDGRELSTTQMQALARQLNLSETTFVLPSERATARVRIFTPGFEMPFAGHPTLGTAHVVRALTGHRELTLEENAGIVAVACDGDRWTLRAAKPPATRPAANRVDLARMLYSVLRHEAMAYVWARDGAELVVRFFFSQHGAILEDPATGSACANLGGWMLATGRAAPFTETLRQGDAVARPSQLGLRVDADRGIFVTGAVVELGSGTMDL